MRRIASFILIILLMSQALAFPELSSSLKELWDIPIDSVKFEKVRSYLSDSIRVEETYLYSRTYKGETTKIFSYFCYPQNQTKALPAILLVHGGGGTASFQRSVDWAKKGYAVLSIDLPGKGENRIGSKSTGPDMVVKNLLNVSPNLKENYLIHAVAATRNAITFLTQRKEVDKERIGMVGLSWGGVITLLTNGQDNRLKTAVNVFGAGYIPEGCTWQDWFDGMSKDQLSLWNSSVDPKNFLISQHAPILFITGTNDHCYYLPIFQKSFEEITIPKQLYLVPNLRHRFLPDTQQVIFSWLKKYLSDGKKFPEIEFTTFSLKENDRIVAATKTTASSQIKNVKMFYAEGGPNRFTAKEWKETPAFLYEGVYYISIPVSILKPEILFYASVFDDSGAVSSTPICSLFKLLLSEKEETYALTSPIKQINIHQPPIKYIGKNNLPRFPQICYSKNQNTYYLINYKKVEDKKDIYVF